MTEKLKDNGKQSEANCNVSTTFNFVVGGVAIVAALIIFFVVRSYF